MARCVLWCAQCPPDPLPQSAMIQNSHSSSLATCGWRGFGFRGERSTKASGNRLIGVKGPLDSCRLVLLVRQILCDLLLLDLLRLGSGSWGWSKKDVWSLLFFSDFSQHVHMKHSICISNLGEIHVQNYFLKLNSSATCKNFNYECVHAIFTHNELYIYIQFIIIHNRSVKHIFQS